ncbi:tyrosine-type recombinase/integrase [Rhodococcus sp. USK10]|uniref:tyrosine-type recombinase/integrase n=1 Tax=Rhodococcus sp. USK10 TaxID=2789739 RepID=UPI001C5EDAA4|nr:tyrosine-type recombinase/integrase [Rhodococcus sp. USK10]QYB02737.1 tyrosine-type recombinase/integrase [Rhodococcus sp. USK10]
MAHVQKRTTQSGAVRYVVKWRTPDGKGRSKGGFPTKKSAEDYATTVEYNATRGTTFDPKAGGVAFRQAAGEWLASRHDLKPRTHAEYANLLRPKTTGQLATRVLSIDATFGGYPLNAITRKQISEWVQALTAAGKKPSTVRHAYFVVRMVLAQAVVDGRLTTNPADYVKLPSERSAAGGTPGVVDDPDMFLTAEQVTALVDATPWPYNVLVHLAAWSGLRAAELAGLQVGDVELPAAAINPNARPKPGTLRVERTVIAIDGKPTYDTPKTKGSRRRVPLTPASVAVLRDYLVVHPRGAEPMAPLFPAMRLVAAKPTGLRATDADGKRIVPKAEDALAALSVEEAKARLTLDWGSVLRHPTFYKAVYRPAVLRANRLGATLPPALKFHALRHTYASLCVAAGIPPLELARFMGHAKVTTTLSVYAHLFEDDHADAMVALGAMGTPPRPTDNVVPIRRGDVG